MSDPKEPASDDAAPATEPEFGATVPDPDAAGAKPDFGSSGAADDDLEPEATDGANGDETPGTPAAPAEAPDQPVPPADDPSDDLDDAGPKFEFSFPSSDLGPELEARIDELAPETPPYVLTDEERERWAYCARVATMVAMNEFGGDGDSEITQFAWSTARSFYADPASYPMPTPDEAAAMRTERGEAAPVE